MFENKVQRVFIYIITLIFSLQIAHSQGYSTKSKKAIQYYENASTKMQIREFNSAIDFLQKAIAEDKNFVEAYLLSADAWDFLNNPAKVVENCQNALNTGGDKYPVTYFFLTQALFKNGDYANALKYGNSYIEKKQYTPKQKLEIEKTINNSKFAINAIQHPVLFKPIDLDENINSKYDEYWPCLTADEEMMVFTRLLPKNENNPNAFKNRQEDLFYSKFVNNTWQKAINMGYPINTYANEGAESITTDGKKMYFTACNREEGYGLCDIYMTEKLGDGWSVPINLGEPINTNYSEKQPFISSDGKTLYFASNRSGGKGNFDIWYSTCDDQGKWSKPVNMGDSINTPDDEQSPFIHPDNHTFYFSSEGWPGMGGYDVFYSRKNDKNEWSKAINIGYPINTNADEIGLIVNAKGDKAYFASDRIREKGKDIFEFELYKEARPTLVSYLKGKVFDSETNKPLDAKFELIDLKTGNTINQAVSNKFNGEFLVCIPTDCDYALNVSRINYLFYSENFTLTGVADKSQPFLKDVPLQSIKTGNKVVLRNIFFETNSYELKNESTAELNKLVQFLNQNPTVNIEVSGHTDNVGSDQINQKLSENRAKSVYSFLILKGIKSDRIMFKGYGKTQPVSDNSTDAGRALNRRTEIKITSK